MAQPHRNPEGDGQQSSLARPATAPIYGHGLQSSLARAATAQPQVSCTLCDRPRQEKPDKTLYDYCKSCRCTTPTCPNARQTFGATVLEIGDYAARFCASCNLPDRSTSSDRGHCDPGSVMFIRPQTAPPSTSAAEITYSSDGSSAMSYPKKVFGSSGSPSAPPGLRSDISPSAPTSQNQLQRPSTAPPDLNRTPAKGDLPPLDRVLTPDPFENDQYSWLLQCAYSPPASFASVVDNPAPMGAMPHTMPFAPYPHGGQMGWSMLPPWTVGWPTMPQIPFSSFPTQAPGPVPPTAPAGRVRIDAHAERAHAQKSTTHDQSVIEPSAEQVPGDDEGPFNGPWEKWYIWRVKANEIGKKGTGPTSDTFRLATDSGGDYPFKMRMDRDLLPAKTIEEIGRRSENSYKFALICNGLTEGKKDLKVIWRLAVDTQGNAVEVEEKKFSPGRHYDFACNRGKTCRLQQDMTLPTMTDKKEIYVHLQRQQRQLDNQEGGNKDTQEEATKLEDDPNLLAEWLAELRGKTLEELKEKAIEIGISRDPVDDVDDEECPKEACIQLILKKKAKPVKDGALKSSLASSGVAVADDILKRMKIDSAVTPSADPGIIVQEVAKIILGANKTMKETKMELKKIAEDKGINGAEITDVLMEEDRVVVHKFVRLIFQRSPTGLQRIQT